jgi:hypothetical protein
MSSVYLHLSKCGIPVEIVSQIQNMATGTPKHDKVQYSKVLNEFQRVLSHLDYLPTLEMAIDHNRLTREQYYEKHGNLMEQEAEEDLAQDRWEDAERDRLEEAEMMYQEGDNMSNE